MNFPGTLKSKLHKTGTTIFTIMSWLANEVRAINLSQGFPDFKISKDLIGLVNKYMLEGNNQYAPMPGYRPLREKLAAKINKLYSALYDPDKEITITAGGTQAIYAAITSIIKEGDEVIVFEPAYDCYVPAIELNGGIPVQLHRKGPDFLLAQNLFNS